MPAAKEQGVKEMRSESLLGASEKALVAHACFAVFIEAEMFGLLVLLLTAPSIVSIHACGSSHCAKPMSRTGSAVIPLFIGLNHLKVYI